MAKDDEAVLPGPRQPCWGCPHCGRNQNWACRVRCICGKAAPQSVIQRAKENAKKSSPGEGNRASGPRGAWARGPPVLKA
eukprot:7596854-Pyramimonas_sp.AAC.1